MKGNKGEWSELYVFFQLLGEGKLFSADEDLNLTNDFVNIVSIHRKDSGRTLAFERLEDSSINIVEADSHEVILSFPIDEAKQIARKLVAEIGAKEGVSNEIKNEISKFRISQVKQPSKNKGDITIVIFDPKNGVKSTQEFSIKSLLGSSPTLFNANKTTNIIYRIEDLNNGAITEGHFDEVNSISGQKKYIHRIQRLLDLGYSVVFDSYEDETFYLNLKIIDSDLPQIIAFVVLDKYVNSVTKIPEVIKKLSEVNPMEYNLNFGHKFYEYRIVNFLVESALGMTSKSVWSGEYDVIGGVIVVKPDTNLACYHLIDFNKFKRYLRNASRLDNPSGSKMDYGSVYLDQNRSFIKLNFQVKA